MPAEAKLDGCLEAVVTKLAPDLTQPLEPDVIAAIQESGFPDYVEPPPTNDEPDYVEPDPQDRTFCWNLINLDPYKKCPYLVEINIDRLSVNGICRQRSRAS